MNEARILKIERQIQARFNVFNAAVESKLGQFITTSGIDYNALTRGYQAEVKNFVADLVNVFIQGVNLSSNDVPQQSTFDPMGTGAMAAYADLRNRVMQGLLRQQAEALAEFRRLSGGIPSTRTVKEIKQSLTLTGRQVKAVDNYRTLLENGSREALGRGLRDRRFDGTIRRSIEDGAPLTSDQIDNMVSAYRRKQLNFRAKAISSTEAVRIANQSDKLYYDQLVETGELEQSQVTRTWVTSSDERVRDSHSSIAGVTVGLNEVWVSGLGNSLRYPGDPNAPAADVINCRCYVATEIVQQRQVA